MPETLHALIAARLDGLAAEERRLLQDAAVLGKTFTKQALAALAGLAEAELEPLLVAPRAQGGARRPGRPALARARPVRVPPGPRRQVAYETLSKRERSARHLAAAAYLERCFARRGGDRRGRRRPTTSRHTRRNPTRTTRPRSRGGRSELLVPSRRARGDRSAHAARRGATSSRRRSSRTSRWREPCSSSWRARRPASAEFEAAEQAPRAALALYEQTGEPHAAARVSGRLGNLEVHTGRGDEGMRRMEEAFDGVVGRRARRRHGAPRGASRHGSWSSGELERAAERDELALGIAQALRLPETLARALGTKACLARAAGRPEEELALTRHALRSRSRTISQSSANRVRQPLGQLLRRRPVRRGARGARRGRRSRPSKIGERAAEMFVLGETTYALTMTGRWDEAVAIFDELPEEQLRADTNLSSVLSGVLEILLHRGQIDAVASSCTRGLDVSTESTDVRSASHTGCRPRCAAPRAGSPRPGDAGDITPPKSRHRPQAMKQGLVRRVESALALGEPGRADELLADGRGASHRACGRRSSTRRLSASALAWPATRRASRPRQPASASTASRSGSPSRCSSMAS